jgi:hypothetical protein
MVDLLKGEYCMGRPKWDNQGEGFAKLMSAFGKLLKDFFESDYRYNQEEWNPEQMSAFEKFLKDFFESDHRYNQEEWNPEQMSAFEKFLENFFESDYRDNLEECLVTLMSDFYKWLKDFVESDYRDYNGLLCCAAWGYKLLLNVFMRFSHNYWDEEDYFYNADLMVMEVFFGGEILPDEKIDYKIFAGDYEKYWKVINNIEGDSLEGTVLHFVNMIKAEDNPMVDTELNGKVTTFLPGRAKDFYERFVKGDTLDKKAEVLYFNMFAVYLKAAGDIGQEDLEKVKSTMNAYKKNNMQRNEIINVLVWAADVAIELEENLGNELTYQGLLSFLNNFDLKRRILQSYWRGYFDYSFEYCKECSEDNLISTNPTFFMDFVLWANEHVTRVMGDWKKDNTMSVTNKYYCDIIRNFFQKESYDKSSSGNQVVYRDTFTELVDLDDTSGWAPHISLRKEQYKKTWAILLEAFKDSRESCFLSIIEHRRLMGFMSEFADNEENRVLCNSEEHAEVAKKAIGEIYISINMINMTNVFCAGYVQAVRSIFKIVWKLTEEELDKNMRQMFLDFLQEGKLDEGLKKKWSSCARI